MLPIQAFGSSPAPSVDGTLTASPAGSSPLPLLPLPAVSLDDDLGAQLAELAVQSGSVEQQEAREAQNADQALAQAQAEQEVQSLRSEASAMQGQAWLDGSVALLQCAAGGKSSGAGSVLAGIKGVGDGFFAAAEKNDEANAKAFEAAVSTTQAAAGSARDARSDAQSYVQAALDFYQQYVTTKGQTASVASGGK